MGEFGCIVFQWAPFEKRRVVLLQVHHEYMYGYVILQGAILFGAVAPSSVFVGLLSANVLRALYPQFHFLIKCLDLSYAY